MVVVAAVVLVMEVVGVVVSVMVVVTLVVVVVGLGHPLAILVSSSSHPVTSKITSGTTNHRDNIEKRDVHGSKHRISNMTQCNIKAS